MNQFRDFNIKSELKSFGGEKIKIQKVLNKEIIVQDYKVEASKYTDKGDGQRLVLQVLVDEVQHIIFSGSIVLREMIAKAPKEKFPFKTIIVQEGERFEFT